MKKTKKFLSFLLALTMLLGTIAFTAHAAEPVYNDEPQLIYTYNTVEQYHQMVDSPWSFSGVGHWGDAVSVCYDVFNNTTASFKIVGNAGWGDGLVFPVHNMAGNVGRTGVYKATFWAYAPDGDVNFVAGFDAGGGNATYSGATATNKWQMFEFEYTIGFNIAGGGFQFGDFASAPGSFLYLDDIRIYELAPPAPTPTPEPVAGTYPNPEMPNLLPGGDFAEANAWGPGNDYLWNVWSGMDSPAGFVPGVIQTEDANFPNVLFLHNNSSHVNAANWHPSGGSGLTVGETYLLSITYYCSDSSNYEVGIGFTGWSNHKDFLFNIQNTNGQWVTESVTFIPTNAGWGNQVVSITRGNSWSPGNLYIAQVKIELGTGITTPSAVPGFIPVAPTPSPAPTATPVPTVAPTPQPSVMPGENLLENGDFTSGTAGWHNFWGMWVIQEDGPVEGLPYVRTSNNWHNIQKDVFLPGGFTYQISFWMKTETAPFLAGSGMFLVLDDGDPGSRDNGPRLAAVLADSDEWGLYAAMVNIGEDTNARISFRGNGEYLNVADVKIVEAAEYIPPKPPMSLPNIGSHRSVLDFNFTNVDGWGWGISADNNTFAHRAPALRINANGGWSAGLTRDVTAVCRPSTTYVLRGLYKADTEFGFDFGIIWRTQAQIDSGISSNENHMLVSYTTDPEWQYAQYIFTVPDNAAYVRLYVCSAQANASTFYMSDMQLLELSASSVYVAQEPNITMFDTGQHLNLDGMILRVGYAGVEFAADISVKVGMSGLTVSGYDRFTPGMQTLSLNYMGIDFTLDVEVMEGGLDPIGIAQYTHAKKTHYWVGEEFDFTGTSFYWQFRNGDSVIITATDAMIDSGAFNKDVPGVYPIVVSYDGFSYTYDAKVTLKNHFTTTPDGRILDPNGDDFIGIGVNVNGNAMWGRPNGRNSSSVRQDVDLLADTWKFNIVRVVCTFQFDHPALWNRHWHYDDLDLIVEDFTNKGVVSKLEMHDYTGIYPLLTPGSVSGGGDGRPLSLYEFTEAWVNLALRYKDNPYVWINIMNEPSKGGDDQAWINVWRNYFETNYGRSYPAGYSSQLDVDVWYYVHDYVITALRAAGIENLIVLDENHYGQSGFNAADPFGIGSPCIYWGNELNEKHGNLAYSIHPYGWSNLDRMIAYADAMEAKGLAWMFGEYGPSYGDLNTHMSTMNVLTVHLMYGIGHMYWDWSNDPMAVVDRDLPGIVGGWGWEIDRKDGTKPTNLTWFGGLLWDNSRGELKLPIPRFVFPIIFNGDFSDGTLHPWHNFGGELRLVQGGSHDLSTCAELMAGKGYTGQTIDFVNIIPGATYRFSMWGKLAFNDIDAVVDCGFAYTAAGVPGEPHEFLFFSETEWTYKEILFTMPDAEVLSGRVFLWMQPEINHIPFFFDKVNISPVLCDDCGQIICVCVEDEPCSVCGEDPCVCVYCDVCGELEDDCTCVYCDVCGELEDDCTCEEPEVCDVCGKDPCVCVSIVGYSNAKFISIVETSKNSRVWTLTFSVTVKMSNNTTAVKNFAVALEGNNANLDGVFKFAANHELAGFKLQYDIKGNGSNIKDFKLI